MKLFRVLCLDDVCMWFDTGVKYYAKKGDVMLVTERDFYFRPEHQVFQIETDSQYYIAGCDNVYFAVEPV